MFHRARSTLRLYRPIHVCSCRCSVFITSKVCERETRSPARATRAVPRIFSAETADATEERRRAAGDTFVARQLILFSLDSMGWGRCVQVGRRFHSIYRGISVY